jgi:DNA-binding response OmpR family regulator
MRNRVLIVEDDSATVALWTKHLCYHGWQVQTTSSAAIAAALVDENPPDAVILDINLDADQSGWDLLSGWRAASKTAHMPVYVVSSLDKPSREQRHGATDVLVKPCSPHLLIHLLSQLHTPL